MSHQLTKALKELRLQRKKETLESGWKEVPEWAFIGEKGQPLDEGNWRKRVFRKALERAGLRQVRIHDLRHTYASLLIQAGESLAYVRDQSLDIAA
jgi:integrase